MVVGSQRPIMTNGRTIVSAKPLIAIKDTSSSSGKVFAKPTKEWVVPERTKPGRKISVEEPDNKRQSQNRLSQRAHRARRTDYISTLEERLRQYEANEIHSNVRLQEVARALKGDNEKLKKENAELKAENEGYKNDIETLREGMKTLKEDLEALKSTQKYLDQPRSKASPPISRRSPVSQPTSTQKKSTAPSKTHSRRATIDCPICPNPDPDCPCQQPQQSESLSSSSAPLATLTLAARAIEEHDSVSPHKHAHVHEPVLSSVDTTNSTCGVCQSDDDCLCRVVEDRSRAHSEVKQEHVEMFELDITTSKNEQDGCGLCTSATFCACKIDSEQSTDKLSVPSKPSIPAVSLKRPSASVASPLPKRRAAGEAKANLWRIDNTQVATGSAPMVGDAAPVNTIASTECSGDPRNCEACRNDSFGQEFCNELYTNPRLATKPCEDCPGNCMSISSLLCSDKARSGAVGSDSKVQGRMTPDQAWKTLKAHPNSKHASLSLLAEVVARRTTCIGFQSDHASASGTPPSSPGRHALPVATTRNRDQSRSSAAMPIDHRSDRGFTRRLEVETSGVRDALKLLDGVKRESETEVGGSGEPGAKRRKVDLVNDW